MSKIRLLILSLTSILLFSCTSSQNENKIKLSISYIGGGYNGLMLSNKLKSHLNNLNMLDDNSEFQIEASISLHTTNLYITNIDNTSDRERVDSSINLKIYDSELDCYTYEYEDNLSQFYVLAAGDKFISNKNAEEKIKEENIDYFIKVFINNLNNSNFNCNDKK